MKAVFRTGIGVLLLAAALGAQAPLEYSGQPMRVAFECTSEDVQQLGLSCSEEEPCPVYLELNGLEAVGNRTFLSGNIHTPTATLYSLLLTTDDNGKTWSEAYPRIRYAILEQIQFVDFENGFIAGTHPQPLPREPFFLITDDGGKTWNQRPIFEEGRPGSIERFWFDSKTSGTLLLDTGSGNRHELYESMTGGSSWMMRRSSASRIPFPREKVLSESGWRLSADAKTHSYRIEKKQPDRWETIASFQVNLAPCKPH